jgi:methanogenic corrinoid protein MtbC1
MDRLPYENTRHVVAQDDPAACQEPGLAAAGQAAMAAPGAWFGSPTRSPTAEERLARLVRTIEADIIPRLVQAHRSDEASGSAVAGGERRVAEVDPSMDAQRYAHLVLRAQASAWVEPVERLRDAGCSLESIYLDLLAPTARVLGDLWIQDLCSFSDVTIGTGRLQQLIHHLDPQEGEDLDARHDGRRVLLLTAPGEQHTFGLRMVADFFARDGWEVVGGSVRPGLDPVALVAKEWFDVVGFSVGHVAKIEGLAMIVRQIRQVSRNRAVGVMAGGPAVVDHPERAAALGVDAVAVDGREAPRVAQRLLSERTKRRP